MVDYQSDQLELVASRYDSWRIRFREERDRLQQTVSTHGLSDSILRIEHVGSTAIPDLAAKDIVDIDVVVEDT